MKKTVKYSIDKLKIEFQDLRDTDVQMFLDKLEKGSLDSEYTSFYTSSQMSKCKYNYIYGSGDGAIYLGVVPNWKKEEKHTKSIVLEYNPNKACPMMSNVFDWLFKTNKVSWHVMSVDIAADMSLEYSNIVMLKRDKREEFHNIGHSAIETRYLGALGHGHIKLYDKAKEQKLKGVNWSRFEITLKEKNTLAPTLECFSETCKIPKLYSQNVQLSFNNLNDIDNLALIAIISDINLLYTVKRYETRKKLEKALHDCLEVIPLDIKSMYQTYVNFFRSLGEADIELTNNSVLWKTI